MTEDFIAWSRTVGGFLADPGPWVVAVFSFVVSTPITFLAVQTMKRQYYARSGKEYDAARIQRFSWAWFCAINTTLQQVMYWGTSSRPAVNIWLASTVIGVVCYVGFIEWWIDAVRARYPRLWNRIRTRKDCAGRRATDGPPPPAATAEMLGIRNPIHITDPDETNH